MEEKINFEKLREEMIELQMRRRGIKNEKILAAFLKIPREKFVPVDLQSSAYNDCPLPIGFGQTISQPYMVAIMTELAEPEQGDKVLEIGTGSGYQTAILCELGCNVNTIERIPELAEKAEKTLYALGYKPTVIVGDGTLGCPGFAPYRIIIVTAGAPEIPQPLVEQIEEGGKIIIPVGDLYSQELLRCIKRKGKLVKEYHGGCQFVPLKGKEGWK